MRIQTRQQVEEQARAWRLLREDLKATRQHAAALAADLVQTRQRADRAEAEATTAREALTKGHSELLADNDRLRRANRVLQQQVEDAIGYGHAELAVIDAGGEKALAAAQMAAAAKALTAKPATAAAN